MAKIRRGIDLQKFTKHVSLFGLPGGGKTTLVMHVILQLFEMGVPFLLIDPVKKEYRSLALLDEAGDHRRFAKALQIYTPGSDVSPQSFNPLEPLSSVGHNQRIARVRACFEASLALAHPMQELLGESLVDVYRRHPDPVSPPVLSDLISTIGSVVGSKRYSKEVRSNILEAQVVRLADLVSGPLERVFACRRSVPSIPHLMASPTVVELAAVPRVEEKCSFTLFLLGAIREYVTANYKSGEGLRFVVVIEEAHNIVGRNADASPMENIADPKAKASEFVCQMLAELRALGVGIIIVDQNPSAVARDVIKNTATKLSFRLADTEDREDFCSTILAPQSLTEEVGRLRPGEAIFFTEGYHAPRRIRTVNLQEKLQLQLPPSDSEMPSCVKRHAWFRDSRASRLEAEFAQLQDRLQAFEDERMKFMQDSLRFRETCQEMLQGSAPRDRRRFARFKAALGAQKKQLATSFRFFVKYTYRPFMTKDAADSALRASREDVARYFRTVVAPFMRTLFRSNGVM